MENYHIKTLWTKGGLIIQNGIFKGWLLTVRDNVPYAVDLPMISEGHSFPLYIDRHTYHDMRMQMYLPQKDELNLTEQDLVNSFARDLAHMFYDTALMDATESDYSTERFAWPDCSVALKSMEDFALIPMFKSYYFADIIKHFDKDVDDYFSDTRDPDPDMPYYFSQNLATLYSGLKNIAHENSRQEKEPLQESIEEISNLLK